MSLRQTAGAALVGTTVLAGAASAVPTLDADPLVQAAAYAHAACPELDREQLTTAVAIVPPESGGRPDAVGDTTITDGTWGPSYGLWQVRSMWDQEGTGQARDASRLTDPAFNALAMCEISSSGTNWRPWTGYTSGAYQAHLDEARAAVDQVLTGQAGPALGLPQVQPGAPAQPAAASRHEGLTLRFTDALLGTALDGWETLNGRAQERSAEAPDLARVMATVDEARRRYTDPHPGQPPPGTPAPAGGQVASSAQMACPIAGPVEHRPDFGDPRSNGRRHAGNDIFASAGTPVVAPFDGVVTEVANDEAIAGLGGLAVWIRAEGGPMSGTEVFLAHNARNVATRGQRVKAGQVVGYVGDTGNARGVAPQVHVQVHPAGGPPVDPWPLTSAACAANRKVQA